MKLKKFDSSYANQRRGLRTISFNKQSGMVSISKEAAINMDLKSGSKIALHQSQENPKDWFLGKDEDGIPLRRSNASGSVCFNCTKIASAFIDSLGINENSCKTVVSHEPQPIDGIIVYPIITRLATGQDRKPNQKADDLRPQRF